MHSNWTSSVSAASIASSKRLSADGVGAVRKHDENLLGVSFAMLCVEVGCEDDRIEQGCKATGLIFRQSLRGMGGAAIPRAKQRRFGSLKTNKERFSSGTPAVCEISSNVGNFLAKPRLHRLAPIDQNADFKVRPVGATKAAEIADDNILVNHCEITGLQRRHSVIVLVQCRKVHPNFGGIATVNA